MNTERTKLNRSTIGQVCLRFAHAVATIIELSSLDPSVKKGKKGLILTEDHVWVLQGVC